MSWTTKIKKSLSSGLTYMYYHWLLSIFKMVISRWEFTSDAGIAILAINQHCNKVSLCPANTRHWPNVVLFLGQFCRKWANNKTTLCQWPVFPGCTWFDVYLPGSDVCPRFLSVFARWWCVSYDFIRIR